MSKLIYLLLLQYYKVVGTIFFRIKCSLYGVNYGSKVFSFGNSFILRKNKTKIYLGNNITLRSKSKSNLIGINRPCMISTLLPNAKIIIGDNCGMSGTVIAAFKHIQLGNSVRCGANTLITDSDWHLDDIRSGKPSPVYIDNNVWLGEGVKVLKGVSIGENTVIGAGSTVTKDIPANVIAAGNPCKIIKSL